MPRSGSRVRVPFFAQREHFLSETNRIRVGRNIFAKIAQLVEHDLAKVGVAGSSPVFRSNIIPSILILSALAIHVRVVELVDTLL